MESTFRGSVLLFWMFLGRPFSELESGLLFMLIYADLGSIWELILVTFRAPKRAWEGKRDFPKTFAFPW